MDTRVGETVLMRHLINKFALLTLATAALFTAAGCSSMKNGPMTAVTPVTPVETQRVGSVYLLRGFIGIFSTGIDNLGSRIDKEGVHAQVFQEAQWSQLADEIVAKYKGQPNHEPIVLIGHSYGADGVVKISRKVRDAGVKVDLVVTLDPVTPPKVPNNIGLVYNLYQSSALDNLPFLRGIPLKPDDDAQTVALRNMNIRKDRTDLLEPGLDHFNIEKKKKVQDDIIAQVLTVCQPRQQWAMARASRTIAEATAKPSTPAIATPAASVTPVVATATPVAAKPTEPAAQLANASLLPDSDAAKKPAEKKPEPTPAASTATPAKNTTLLKASAE